jgi:hypothetical protein
VLVEQPEVLPDADRLLSERSVRDRCEFVGGSFFNAIPAAGEVWTLCSFGPSPAINAAVFTGFRVPPPETRPSGDADSIALGRRRLSATQKRIGAPVSPSSRLSQRLPTNERARQREEGSSISACLSYGRGDGGTDPARQRPLHEPPPPRPINIGVVADHVLVGGSKTAAVLNTSPQRLPPPDTSTRPLSRRMAITPLPTTIGRAGVGDQAPVAGAQSSAVPLALHDAEGTSPPTISTRPVLKQDSAVIRLGVMVSPAKSHAPVAGLNTSAGASGSPDFPAPPVSRTRRRAGAWPDVPIVRGACCRSR